MFSDIDMVRTIPKRNPSFITIYLVVHRKVPHQAPTGIYPKSGYGRLPFHTPDIVWYTDLAPNEGLVGLQSHLQGRRIDCLPGDIQV